MLFIENVFKCRFLILVGLLEVKHKITSHISLINIHLVESILVGIFINLTISLEILQNLLIPPELQLDGIKLIQLLVIILCQKKFHVTIILNELLGKEVGVSLLVIIG